MADAGGVDAVGIDGDVHWFAKKARAVALVRVLEQQLASGKVAEELIEFFVKVSIHFGEIIKRKSRFVNILLTGMISLCPENLLPIVL